MNRTLILTKRNLKEIVVEPLSIIFCLALPLVMLVGMELIYMSMSEEMQAGAVMFRIENFASGIAVFGFTFTAMFLAISITSDKNSAFMTRLLISPVKPIEYYISFVLSALPLCFFQTVLFYLVAFCFGLKLSGALLVSIVYLIPAMLFYISSGLLVGALVNHDNEAGPLCSILVSGAGILGGVWMPVETLSEGFFNFCKILPFYNTVKPSSKALLGDYNGLKEIVITLMYTVVFITISALVYKKKLKK